MDTPYLNSPTYKGLKGKSPTAVKSLEDRRLGLKYWVTFAQILEKKNC